jgi:EpsI family protein
VDFGEPVADPAALGRKSVTTPLLTGLALLLVAAVGVQYLQERESVSPPRTSFADMPMNIGDWSGRNVPVEQIYINQLQMEDWLSASYTRDAQTSPVDLWVAYYANQRKGASAHSPRSCLPGGGWRIDELRTRTIDDVPGLAGSLDVNRMEISYGQQRMLVYYWFKQRERHVTSEYVVKWYLFWDAFTRNRTDGALIRLSVPLAQGEDMAAADATLTQFLRDSYPDIARRVPD